MKRFIIIALAALAPQLAAAAAEVAAAAGGVVMAESAPAEADGTPARPFAGTEVTLDQFRWVARPVVVFADTEADPAFQRQMELLASRAEALAERDVVVIIDTSPEPLSEVRRALRPRGFSLVIIDKDGQVATRKPAPWDVREISRTIDKMPLRLQEIRERRLTR